MVRSVQHADLAFFIPCVGLKHQEYLLRLYEGLEGVNRVVLAFWLQPGGWRPAGGDVLLLSSPRLYWRIVNRLYHSGMELVPSIQRRSEYAPLPPIGWMARMQEHIATSGIRLLHIPYAGLGVAISRLLRKTRIPFVVNCAGSDPQMSDRFPWYADQLRWLWDNAQACTFASRFLQRQAIERGCPEDKTRVMYLGTPEIESHAFIPRAGGCQFICVANLHPVKGHRFLLEAFRIVRGKVPDATLCLIGDGPERQGLVKMAQRLGLGESVTFPGSLSWKNVQNHLSRSHVYVQPSIRANDGTEEGLGQGTLEAEAMGLPVVVTSSGGLPETVEDGVTGYVVKPGDSVAMSNVMIELAVDADLRTRMGHAAREFVQSKFSLREQNDRWRALFLDILNKI